MPFLPELKRRFHEDKFTIAKRSTGVFLGFAGLLLLMGGLIVDSGRQVRDVTLDSARLLKEYKERDALLDDLRTNIYRASTLTRDRLLAPDETTAPNAQRELHDISLRNDIILHQYEQLLLPGERENFKPVPQLERSFMETLLAALTLRVGKGEGDRQAFFRDIVLPHRSELIRLVAQVNALDQRDMDAGEQRIQTLHKDFQRRVAVLSAMALAMSVVLATIVVFRHQYLERKAARHFEEVQAAKQDLRLLSNQLVAAQEDERRNLSRELHDEVGQTMTAMLMDLGRLESRLSGLENCREILVSIRRAAEENVARVRDLSLLLRPSMLDELGLVPALQWQVREVARRSGLKVKMIADEFDEDLPEAPRTCVYRIVQEALHNCVKHSRASEARVVLHRDQDALLVSVQDNGIGFDPKQQKGLGLLGIEERALLLGGSFCVESHPGGGAVLSVRFPLPVSKANTIQEGVA